MDTYMHLGLMLFAGLALVLFLSRRRKRRALQ
jgi:hypothetical protein